MTKDATSATPETGATTEPATAAQIDQQKNTALIDQQKKSNRADAAGHARLGLAGLAAYAVATAFFPPAGVAGFVGTFGAIYASLKGWNLIENLGTELSLRKSQQESNEGSTFTKTADRAAKLARFSKTGLKATLGVFGLGVAVALAGWLAPAVVPAALATSAFSLAVGAMIVGASVTSFLDGAKIGASKIVAFALVRRGGKRPDAPARDNGPAAVSSVPSLGPGFGLAANGNETSKPAVVENDAPLLKKDAPKP